MAFAHLSASNEAPYPLTTMTTPIEDTSLREQNSVSEGNPKISSSKSHQEVQALLPSSGGSFDENAFSKVQRTPVTSLTAWWFETLSLLLATGALVAITVTLAKFNRQEQPSWKYRINLNTLVAILSTLLRVGMTVGVEEAISQTKWLWYRRPRPLRHIAHFDAAARGPWGSLLLPFRIRKLSSAALGCLVIIFSVAVGPFTQQTIRNVPCSVPLASSNSSLQIARIITSTNIFRYGAGTWDLDLETKAAILQSLANPNGNGSAIEADCSTGNCTFAEYDGVTHSSIGVCKKCIDVTPWVYEVQIRSNQTASGYPLSQDTREVNLFLPVGDRFDPLFNGSWPYGLSVGGTGVNNNDGGDNDSLPPGTFFNVSSAYYFDAAWLMTSTQLDDSFLAALHTSYLNVSMIALTSDGCNFSAKANTTCSHPQLEASPYWDPYNVVATTCTFYPCVKNYHAVVNDTVFTENLISEIPAEAEPDTSTAVPSYQLSKMPCFENGHTYTPANSSSAEQQPGNQTILAAYGAHKNASVPYECFYNFDGIWLRALASFQASVFDGGCNMPTTNGFNSNSEAPERANVVCRDWWLKSLFNNGNATFGTIDANMEAIAVAITNVMRRQGIDWDGKPAFVKGIVTRAAVCTQFDWPWLAFPVALLLLAAAMVITVGIKTLLDKQEVPVWKATSLPLLFTGNGTGTLGAPKDINGIERGASQTVVRLAREDEGWEFVSERAGNSKEGAAATGNDTSSASSAVMRTRF